MPSVESKTVLMFLFVCHIFQNTRKSKLFHLNIYNQRLLDKIKILSAVIHFKFLNSLLKVNGKLKNT